VPAEGERPTTVSEEEISIRPDSGRWTRGLGFALIALVVAALVSLLAFGLLNEGEEGTGAASLNREAPDFALNLFDGGTFTLSENRGQPVVMNIWASWCESCRQEAADMERGWRSFRDQGVIFVGVNVMDSRGGAEAFLEQFDITYPNGPDESDIYFRYGVTGTPETFFIDRDGVIVQKFVGALTAEQLAASVEALLQ
jgi:cytochrome c biogenesis protein CcmG/thiol:disulfide interchange protein DsbE